MGRFTISRALRDEAQRRGVLTRYNFCGELVYGTDRNDAIHELMKDVFARARKLLQIEFGAKARFRPRPGLGGGHPAGPDFWWSKANFGVTITGPYYHSQADVGLHRRNDRSSPLRYFARAYPLPGNPEIVRVPYHVVMRTPQKFLQSIRERLIASGAYPRLL